MDLGPSHWQELLKIRREVLQEKREAEALARREAIERQELAITVAGIVVLLLFSAVRLRFICTGWAGST